MDFLTILFIVFLISAVIAAICIIKRRRSLQQTHYDYNFHEMPGYFLIYESSPQDLTSQNFRGRFYQFPSPNSSYSSQGFQPPLYPPNNYNGSLMNYRREV
jgi:hypothetical protein